jgi:glucose-6-phosphate 1-dehydrogenase
MALPTRVRAGVHVNRAATAEESSEPLRVRDPFALVIFGASGDLAKRKLIPALYQLQAAGYLPDRYAVIGFSRTPMSDEQYREAMREELQRRAGDGTSASGTGSSGATVAPDDPLVRALHYQAGNNDDRETFLQLKERLDHLDAELGLGGNRLFYLSVAPEFFPAIIRNLAAAGLIHGRGDASWSRVIIEKPFGTDLASARELNAIVTSVLDESQIYRIDHYLGKETVQNILSFRFGNAIFEPLFTEKYVDHVQITVAETLGMEGRRGAYYDHAGALRDVVQNHMLQLLCLIAMEPPSALDADSIRDEKVKILRTLVPLSVEEVAASTVRGQYGVGERDGKVVKGYRQEEGVDPKSLTETYVALRVRIDNWRWAGVPFLLRSGKCLARRVSEIVVQFKQPPLLLFRESEECGDLPPTHASANLLVMRIQPNEGISLSFACKRPGMRIHLEEVTMDFFYGEAFRERSPEAYERLLLDALRGDASLFTRSDEVEYSWRFITSIHQGWAELPPPKFPNYYPFSDGPEEATHLFAGRDGGWRPLRDD